MISSFKKIAATTTATLALVFGVSLLPVFAQPVGAIDSPQQDRLCAGVDATGTDDCNNGGGEDDLKTLVKNILNIFSWIIGVISVIMIIIGGFRYIISAGDSGHLQSAKNTILYAVVGLVVVLFAQLIVRFVVGAATGAAEGFVHFF